MFPDTCFSLRLGRPGRTLLGGSSRGAAFEAGGIRYLDNCVRDFACFCCFYQFFRSSSRILELVSLVVNDNPRQLYQLRMTGHVSDGFLSGANMLLCQKPPANVSSRLLQGFEPPVTAWGWDQAPCCT